ncbi:MAG TPA: DUF2917 domain-containing protein [Albitalea sp.]|uniref:DUF2917 domain-containing protein n=1 Tax=Piscinibacter sp. TaxID=1903157 RepID=UPI002ED57F44
MLLNARHARLSLAQDQMAQLNEACQTRVDCVAGVAWITLDGDRRDIVLTRGDSFTVDSNARVIVSAIHGPLAIDLHAPKGRTRCPPARSSHGLWSGVQAWLRAPRLQAA